MALFEHQRSGFQVFLRGHNNFAEKHLLVTVIEVLDHPISPRLRHWDEPGLNVVMQAQPDERTHATGMRRAAKEGHGVVNREVIWDTHACPDGPDAVKDGLSGLGNGWVKSASYRNRINHIQAVESYGSFEVAWTNQIGLMGLVRQERWQLGIRRNLGFIFSCSPMG